MSADSTIKDFLQGEIRGITIPESTLQSIYVKAGIPGEDTYLDELTEKQRELATAWTYVWIATGPATTAKWSESDGDWSQSAGGEVYTATQLRTLLRLADDIFKKYGLATVSKNEWGMRAGGIRNIRYSLGYGHGSRNRRW